MNDNYEVRFISDEKGNGMFAKRLIKNGETIFEEKPIVCCQFAWNCSEEFHYLACDHCLSPLDSAESNVRKLCKEPTLDLPYPECCETNLELVTECDTCDKKYCSPNCKNEAYQSYHKTICLQTKGQNPLHPLSKLTSVWKKIHYPPETMTVMLIVRMVAMAKQQPDVKRLFSKFCRLTINENEAISHYLLGEQFEQNIDVLRELIPKAINTDHVSEWFTPEGFRSLLALIGTNGQGIGTSAFANWVKNVSSLNLNPEQRVQVDKLIDRIYDKLDEVVGTFLNNEGSGLYVTQSAINHSCSPNVSVEFPYSNSTLVLKAIKDIPAEEEICISYLDECNLDRSRHSRQKVLSNMYLFVCKCNKCTAQAEDADVTSDEDDEDVEMSS